jgi:lipopolysaccharide transport system ATP-binding protein
VTHPAIRIANLSKLYRLGSGSAGGYSTLRESISHALAAPWRHLQSRVRKVSANAAAARSEDFWALKDVSFDVQPGEVVGVIGRNGAGKSTFLKILSRVTEPTSGRVELHGRVGSLLEVGTGFHPELTGRENIYLNGAILGMTRAEINRKFDAIVAFAEIGEFLDTPVKRYSSGMYVRLAFAVASHLEPEILIVDEVLAVGDAQFQQKCLGRMSEVRREGRTVLFVSHNMGAVARLCDRAAWLDHGRMRALGGAEDIIADYLATSANSSGEVNFSSEATPLPGSDGVRLVAVRIRNQRGEISSSLDVRHPFTIEMQYRVFRPLPNLSVGLRILTHDGVSVFTTRDLDEGNGDPLRQPGDYVSRCEIPGNFLNYGQYFASFGADCDRHLGHFSLHQVLSFQIEETGGIAGHVPVRRLGILRTSFPWTIEKIDGSPVCTA